MRKNESEIVHYLLTRGISPLLADRSGKNMLHFAIDIENIENAKLILDKEKEWFPLAIQALLSPDNDGYSPVHQSTLMGNLEFTTFFYCILSQHHLIAKLFSLKTSKGLNLIQIAVKYNKTALFDFFFNTNIDKEV